MTRLRDVRRRLEATRTLGEVVATTKTLASVRVHRHRQAVEGLTASTRTLELAFEALIARHPEVVRPLLGGPRDRAGGAEGADGAEGSGTASGGPPSRPPGPLAVVVFGADRGLSGPFVGRIADHAAGLLADRSAPAEAPTILAIGRRMDRELVRRGWPPTDTTAAPQGPGGVDAAAAALLHRIDAWRADARAERLVLVHGRPAGGTTFEATALQLLPLDRSWLRDLRGRTWPSRRHPVLLGDPEEVLRGLVRETVASAVVRAFATSLAAENAARLAAMEAAEKGVERRLETLERRYRAARQAQVTAELLDVRAAFEATVGGGDPSGG